MSCFHTMRMLRKIYNWLLNSTRKTVTQALITSRQEYGKTLYTGITKHLTRRLQTILNAAARLVLSRHPEAAEKKQRA